MKKQILFLIIINNLIVASVSQYSYRILGMGKEVIDFTSDSYSDIYYNPAYLYNENYNNIFSNLSNINKFSNNSLLSTGIHQIDDLISLPSNLVGFTKSNKNSKVEAQFRSWFQSPHKPDKKQRYSVWFVLHILWATTPS